MPKSSSPKPIGRPLVLNGGVSSEICAKLSEGWSLVEICKSAHMPTRACVHMWLLKADAYKRAEEVNVYTEFFDNYIHAREVQADTMMDEILEIADNSMNDYVERENQRTGGTWVELDKEAVLRAKLRVDARFKLASQLAPKKWGTKTQLEVAGKDGGKIQQDVTVRWADEDK